MLKSLIINEIIKVAQKKRTYISFFLITILIPFIVLAVKSGGGSLESKLYGQLADSFIFVGSLVNGNLSAYIIIAILIVLFGVWYLMRCYRKKDTVDDVEAGIGNTKYQNIRD